MSEQSYLLDILIESVSDQATRKPTTTFLLETGDPTSNNRMSATTIGISSVGFF